MRNFGLFSGLFSDVHSVFHASSWRKVFSLAFCFIFGALAQAALESNLVEHSPFLPPGYGQKQAPEDPEQAPVVQGPLTRELEFRGIFEMGDDKKFSIFDKSTQQGQWVPLNGGTDRFSIIGYDGETSTLRIKSGDRIEELSLAEADDKPIPIAGIAPGRVTPPTGAPNFKPPTSPPNSPPASRPPSTIPPPPPAALMQARAAAAAGGNNAVPRRRIIRRSSESSGTNNNASSTPSSTSGVNIPTPPNFNPGPAPNFTPSPPPATN